MLWSECRISPTRCLGTAELGSGNGAFGGDESLKLEPTPLRHNRETPSVSQNENPHQTHLCWCPGPGISQPPEPWKTKAVIYKPPKLKTSCYSKLNLPQHHARIEKQFFDPIVSYFLLYSELIISSEYVLLINL